MVELLDAALVVLLVVLLVIRTIQQRRAAAESIGAEETAGVAQAPAATAERPRTPTLPSPYVPVEPRETMPETPHLDAEARAIRRLARRGEARAAILDVLGYTLAGVAVLVAIGATVALVGFGRSLSPAWVLVIAVGATWSVLVAIALAAMLLGLASVVRNTSHPSTGATKPATSARELERLG